MEGGKPCEPISDLFNHEIQISSHGRVEALQIADALCLFSTPSLVQVTSLDV